MAIPSVGEVITEGMGLYKVLAHEGGTRLRVRSQTGCEISIDYADSGYRDKQRHGWRVSSRGEP